MTPTVAHVRFASPPNKRDELVTASAPMKESGPDVSRRELAPVETSMNGRAMMGLPAASDAALREQEEAALNTEPMARRLEAAADAEAVERTHAQIGAAEQYLGSRAPEHAELCRRHRGRARRHQRRRVLPAHPPHQVI